MKNGPDIAGIAALIGNPARAQMLSALTGGGARTATELALEAGLTKQTVSAHLAKLEDCALIKVEKQGRHRYYRLADRDVGALLEKLMYVAAKRNIRVRPGPKDPALRLARTCYDHLAGDLAVALYDALLANRWLKEEAETLTLTKSGKQHFAAFGLDLTDWQAKPHPIGRPCLDWSVRRHHLAGVLGRVILSRLFALGWARRIKDSREVHFSPAGKTKFLQFFQISVNGALKIG